MGKIADFPEFTRVDCSTREQIHAHTAKYLPYSDFNYTNLLSWDLGNSARASMLNGNMAVCLPDYIDGTEFYSFLGNNEVAQTAKTLLDVAEYHTPVRELRLVPEIGATALESSGLFTVEEDIDGHDYVVSLGDIVAKQGPKYRHLRHEINHFATRHEQNTSFEELDIRDSRVQGRVVEVFLGREKLKSDNDHNNNHENELIALGRLFEYGDLSALDTYGLEICGELKAFMISEKIDGDWTTGHFWKADTNYRGIYRYFMHQIASRLVDEGYTNMNIEQDLGINGLRQMKMFFNPVGHLKKYTVTD